MLEASPDARSNCDLWALSCNPVDAMQLTNNFCIWLCVAVLQTFFSLAFAVGSASVYNNCGIDVYYKAISTFEQNYSVIPEAGVQIPYSLPGVGVSIKLSLSNASIQGPITQFEYTWGSLSVPSVSYDLSNIDGDPFSAQGYPFAQYGLALLPSTVNSSQYPSCQQVVCPSGIVYCSAAYNLPNDNKTLTCDEDTDLTLSICPGQLTRKRNDHIRRHIRGSLRRARHL
jgi:hypothetical protein